MIIWLSSYPRSGNTLVRMMLKRVFGISSHSKYDDKIFTKPGDDSFSAVGHLAMGCSWDAFYRDMSESSTPCLVKTHEGPQDDGAAIYVVRNGLTAVASHQQFCKIFDQQDFSLEELILGIRGPYPSWGAHLDAWDPVRRPRTLILTYESLVNEPERCLDQMADFLKMRKIRSWSNDFDNLHQANPAFFRRGQIEPEPGGISPDTRELFDLIHGDWMAKLGYSDAVTSRHQFCRSVRAAIRGTDQYEIIRQTLTAAQQEIAIQTAAAADRLNELLCKENEIRKLKQACDEREEIIRRLSIVQSAQGKS